MIKNLPAMSQTWVRSLGQEDPLEKGIGIPVFLPGKFNGQRILVGCSLWNHKKLNTTELLTHSLFSTVQSLSHVRLCDPMNRSMPGLPVHHQLLEFTQTHVHWISDAIQPSHPLSPSSPLALNLSQYQDLFQGLALWIRWRKYLSFSFSISPSSEYTGSISLMIY